jgi:polyphosphate kinase 2 (PPK2 family)
VPGKNKKKKNGNDQGKVPLKRKEYERELRKLQTNLVQMQEWVKATGAKIVVVFEGRDAAGKGGVIHRIMERVSPRIFRHVALPAPTEREKSQMYAQRYIVHMPAAGEIILFDRSWYNRIILVKYWFEVSEKEQHRRFLKRIDDPMRTWKLSPMDLESHRRWYDYSRARDAMFAATDTPQSPWNVVQTDDKARARLNCISHLISVVPWKKIPQEKFKLPNRQKPKGYKAPDWNYRWIPEKY